MGYKITCMNDYIPERRYKTKYEIEEIRKSN